MKHIALAIVVPCVLAACPKPSGPADAGAATHDAGTAAAAKGQKRPPFPNMATAAWGQHILEERVSAASSAAAATKVKDVLDALHDVSPGSEVHAAELATAAYQ